ncbi:hypothetical protein IKH83_00510 [Candidatus Saccharibacteria bacterium]|nr:hypothetical protein [Candidatus Saccharibacteria bacterium]
MKKPNIAKWLDGFLLAGRGILMAFSKMRFVIAFIIAFLFFGTMMNLLSGGFSKFGLMDSFGMAMRIIWDSFIRIFGVNQPILDWLPIFLISVLQGLLIGLIVLLWHKKRESAVNADEGGSNAANVEKAGIITGLIALGAGCPTCGTTLLTPLLGALFSTGGLAATGAISTIITIVAIVIAILSLKKLGEETYVMIIDEKYRKEKHEGGKNR